MGKKKTQEKEKKLELAEKKFWVLVGEENLCLYSDKKEAIIGLKETLPYYEGATIAEVEYKEVKGKGTFNVEGVSWKDIALGWVSADEDEDEDEDENNG